MSIVVLNPEKGSVLSFLTEVQKKYIAAEEERAAYIGGDFDYLNLIRSEVEMSLPEPHMFRWTAVDGADKYRITVTREDGDMMRLTADQPTYPMPYMHAGCSYTCQIEAYRGEELLDTSDVVTFATEYEVPRFIRLPDISNVRDCGGWKTSDGRRLAQGKIFRGSEFDRHCELKPEGVRVLQEEMRLKVDMDMRGEANREEPGPLEPYGIERKLIPLSPYQEALHDQCTEAMRLYFTELCNPENYPCYIHCWGGADRTGTIVYILQAVLGVPEADLILDYEMTTLSVWGLRYRRYECFVEFRRELAERFGADGADVQTQARRFLLSTGITEAQLAVLEENMLED